MKVKPKWDPKGRKNLLIIGGIIVIAGTLMVLMFTGGKNEVIKPSAIPEVSGTYGPGQLSGEDKDAISAEEKARLAAAQESGQSGIEVPAEGHPVELTESTKRPQPHQSGPIAATMNSGQQPQAQQVKAVLNDEKLKGLENQMAAQLKGWGMDPSETSDNSGRIYVRIAKKETETAATPSSQGNDKPMKGKGRVIARALEEIHSAKLIGSFDTDAPGTVRARIVGGALEGAVLKGAGKMAGDGVQIAFSDCSFKGVKFKCDAIALDEKTASDIVEGNYNGRYMQRFVFPILADGVKAYANAKAQTGTQVVITAGGGAAQETPAPSNQQARNAMIAAGADQGSKALTTVRKDAQITLDRSATIGIMFIEPVYESDILDTAESITK